MAAYPRVQSTVWRNGFVTRGACSVFLTLLCIASWARAEDGQRRRIYFLESLAPTQFAAIRTIEAFRKRLSEKTTESFEIFIDYMELTRFPGDAHIDRTVQYLRGKYAEAPPDVLIPLGRAAVPFLLKYRDAAAPQAPLIVTSIPTRAAADLKTLSNTVLVVTEYNFSKTLELAMRLQPDARNLVVVAGSSDYDRSWADDARRELEPFQDRYKTRYLVGLPYDEMLREVSQLSSDTIVIVSFVFVDGAGVPRVPPDVAAAIADISPAPVYAPISSFFGHGIVGGYMDSFEAHGVAAADLALEILSGKTPAALNRETKPLHQYEVDARQLQRWGLSESLLPAGSVVRFKESSVWERYRWQMMAIAAAILAQAAMIAGLLFERRRRQTAELESRNRFLEVIHLNRSATAGALSASIAHELFQPLGAILSNAEAAEVLLARESPNLNQVREILADIRRDDQRAGDVIRHLRGLLKKSEIDLQEFDLNDAIHGMLNIIEPEAAKRGVELRTEQVQGALPVRADQVHLQQVVLNLATNGMDAMSTCVPGKRVLTLETALAGSSEVEISVLDSGTGIPDNLLKSIFETFYTTKSQGTGLGLSIARTIVETYGGKIWAENRVGGGAAFRFTLPLAKAHAA